MVGSMIQLFHHELQDSDFLENTFTKYRLPIVLAPGDGLLLERVNYEKLNETKPNSPDIVITSTSQLEEIADYRKALVKHIFKRELQERAFMKWMSWFDDHRDEFLVNMDDYNEFDKTKLKKGIYKSTRRQDKKNRPNTREDIE